MIGPDSNVDMLNDDELDQLMTSLQKHKHLRKGRPESRLTEGDDDNEVAVVSCVPGVSSVGVSRPNPPLLPRVRLNVCPGD
jgi:hypothetical protein